MVAVACPSLSMRTIQDWATLTGLPGPATDSRLLQKKNGRLFEITYPQRRTGSLPLRSSNAVEVIDNPALAYRQLRFELLLC